MSQSPLSESKSTNNEYLDSFARLAQRIRSGNSFSGNERNCAFLNSKNGAFTDVSYSFGLDWFAIGFLFSMLILSILCWTNIFIPAFRYCLIMFMC